MSIPSTMPMWAAQLAGILPLSALIDFLNIPQVFHMFQLCGGIPIWCWPVTPSGSRLLMRESDLREPCWLDRYETSLKPICLDGRYGDQYHMANAETIRIALDATFGKHIENNHPNVEAEAKKRPQHLKFAWIRRTAGPTQGHIPPASSANVSKLLIPWLIREIAGCIPAYSGDAILHNTIATLGFLLWSGLVIFASITGRWIAFGFLIAIISSGLCVTQIHGSSPRFLGPRAPSLYNRLVISAFNTNASEWTLYYGESSLLNSLLNWPLLSRKPVASNLIWLRALRILTFCQWALAIGAAAQQSWDAYVVAFWILFCVISINFVFCTKRTLCEWMKSCAGIEFERFEVSLSSRRALLTTILALNPDTFPDTPELDGEGYAKFDNAAIFWLDGILKPGVDRSVWLEAIRLLLCTSTSPNISIDQMHQNYNSHYWWKYTEEGIDVATKSKNRLNR